MPRHSRSRSRSYSPPRGGGGGGRSPTPEEEFRIHIADLGIDPDKQELEKAFTKFGPIKEVWLARNPPCFSFIVYKNREDAEEAIRTMDGKTLCGSRIRVTWARPRTKGRQRRGFDPNLRCYQCGERGHFSRDCEEIWRYRDKYRGRSRSGSGSPRRNAKRSRSRSPSNRQHSGGGGGLTDRRRGSPYGGGGGGRQPAQHSRSRQSPPSRGPRRGSPRSPPRRRSVSRSGSPPPVRSTARRSASPSRA